MARTGLKDAGKIRHLLARNVEQVIDRAHLEKTLKSGKKLRIKLGIDPTGEKIHIGRAIVLWKLREFQELGHQVVLIIGDFTAQIGDPSDKLSKRPMLSREQVEKNMRDYLSQIGKILDLHKTETRYNSKWLDKLNFRETAELAESFSVQQMLHRRNFQERWKEGQDISLREFLYPIIQGYDSVAIKADVELGGTDQLFNLMAGREVQKQCGQKPQDVMTVGMLSGTDGRKMSTSWGNVINIVDPADEQFGKIMSMHDKMIQDYFHMATRMPEKEIAEQDRALARGANPRDVKLVLAKEIVALYHGKPAAEKAAEKWVKMFSKKDVSGADIPTLKLKNKKIAAVDLVLKSGAATSKGEAWRLIAQGGLKAGEKTISNPRQELNLKGGEVVRVGKKRFFRIN
ncbi:MAG: tyrosine--tRNA ligase [Candidatus Liptonbacteria bacterium RIFCSPLOWO2_01_FULL_56_20]|uniref:Tyrosine--tRNA ligase n=1 Tax=Candidatus Liptonbacteria bacterium RIFCSPLOWO2_01_FULL_56_20 TaxID=1798652 RepID=A0A1G2CHH3_9BACT|nr:MAG: Tyrosine-tRNA ligase [Parcubacteria group bacterium GW2011_GWB1_56_8]OGY97513.1 MAG: tyrosine--tRNA ligase [Candidatus Liptonbacteria bacterium RIFCSPHIGHO2_01_FULL_56_18b]OGZ00662.1 MAG: tyrosine--tRNA ligase [Candidatus Liptonbacteria bacterium RIFCSPLOWO2_01_FULL_56_20]